jgi:hypothetical protein
MDNDVRAMTSECPFNVGEKYRVKENFSYLNHVFHQNEIVVFSSRAYDPHGGVTRHWFQKLDSDEKNAWHVFDNNPDPSQTWEDYFEKV